MKIAGQPVPHESARGHVTGEALYTDDLVRALSGDSARLAGAGAARACAADAAGCDAGAGGAGSGATLDRRTMFRAKATPAPTATTSRCFRPK